MCVFVYLANVCENDVVVRCCFASQLRVCICVCVQATVLWSAASQCTVVCWRCVCGVQMAMDMRRCVYLRMC